MNFDNDLVVGKLRRWEKYLAAYRLPEWDAIPDFGLYMEQVVQFLKQYLDYLPPELRQTEPITAAAINNYVRTKLLPEPRKKRYYRIHIAYLIMICTLKQSLRLSMLPTLLPGNLPEEDVKTAYAAFALRHRHCAKYFLEQVRLTAAAMFDRAAAKEMDALRQKLARSSMTLAQHCQKQNTTPEALEKGFRAEAEKRIRVMLAARAIADALAARSEELENVTIGCSNIIPPMTFLDCANPDAFHISTYFMGYEERRALKAGRADFTSVHLGQVDTWCHETFLPDIAFLDVSLPDENGFVSLSASGCCMHPYIIEETQIGRASCRERV